MLCRLIIVINNYLFRDIGELIQIHLISQNVNKKMCVQDMINVKMGIGECFAQVVIINKVTV